MIIILSTLKSLQGAASIHSLLLVTISCNLCFVMKRYMNFIIIWNAEFLFYFYKLQNNNYDYGMVE